MNSPGAPDAAGKAGLSDATISRLERLLARHPATTLRDSSLTPAGVMVLLYPKEGRYCLLMNKRSQRVRHHKGEISFPGGEQDPADASLLETALRETHEEMGIRPEDVRVLGRLGDTPTISRYLVRPYVGTIPYPYPFRPQDTEVAQVLEVPADALLDPASWRDDVRLRGGDLELRPAYAYQGHLIFGATARILREFLTVYKHARGEEVPWSREESSP